MNHTNGHWIPLLVPFSWLRLHCALHASYFLLEFKSNNTLWQLNFSTQCCPFWHKIQIFSFFSLSLSVSSFLGIIRSNCILQTWVYTFDVWHGILHTESFNSFYLNIIGVNISLVNAVTSVFTSLTATYNVSIIHLMKNFNWANTHTNTTHLLSENSNAETHFQYFDIKFMQGMSGRRREKTSNSQTYTDDIRCSQCPWHIVQAKNK